MICGAVLASISKAVVIPAAALLLQGCAGTLSEGAMFADIPGQPGTVLAPIRSFEDQRFASVVRQAYDFSCGSAALATLLRHHYGRSQDERTVFRGMWAHGDRAQIRQLGFSLLDMKRYLGTLGLDADGYRVTLEEVAAAGVPGIALINLAGYRHFVVVKGVSAEEVLVGDPSRGLVTMPIERFRGSWNGVYFALDTALEQGRSAFNRDAQWAQFSRAPSGGQFLAPLSQQALMLTSPFHREF